MTFDDAIKLMEDGKYTHLKVVDTDGRRVLDLEGETNTTLIEKLKPYQNILSSYGKVKFILATDSIFKQNWKDAYNWTVTFTGANATPQINTQQMGGFGSGMVSQSEALLMAQLAGMQKQLEFNEKFAELNRKIDATKNNSPYDKYLPLLGMFTDIDEQKLKNMMLLSSISGGGQNFQQINGLNDATKHVVGTDEEKKLVEEVEKELEKLTEKVHISSIHEFLKALNDNPTFLDTLTQMAKNFKK